ncbi:hypothetical protein BRD00_00420 [Halobacteriales archaeon QS_8_69_26]|nr:MAG: hypothetical protein BRD00_00420 [Halobacteriales archaeon QS_8_69_26]
MNVGIGSSASGFDDLSRSEVFALLGNERRRYLVQYMTSVDPPVELGELATRIAAREHGIAVARVSSCQRKRVYTTLQQLHLPKLDEAGIVDYDADRGLVDRTERTDDLAVYLEVVPDEEFPWREYYLALGAVFAGVTAALWVGVYPPTLLSTLGWATVLSVLLTASAAVQVLRQRRTRLSAAEFGPDPEEE